LFTLARDQRPIAGLDSTDSRDGIEWSGVPSNGTPSSRERGWANRESAKKKGKMVRLGLAIAAA